MSEKLPKREACELCGGSMMVRTTKGEYDECSQCAQFSYLFLWCLSNKANSANSRNSVRVTDYGMSESFKEAVKMHRAMKAELSGNAPDDSQWDFDDEVDDIPF